MYAARASNVLSNWSKQIAMVLNPPAISDNAKKWIVCGILCLLIIGLPSTASSKQNNTQTRTTHDRTSANTMSSDYMNMWERLLRTERQREDS